MLPSLFLAVALVASPAFAFLPEPPRGTQPCPLERPTPARSDMGHPNERTDHPDVYFQNNAGVPVHIFWCNYDGVEVEMRSLDLGEDTTLKSYPGHIFNVRTVKTGTLVHSIEVWPPQLLKAIIEPCAGLQDSDAMDIDRSRWPEFEALAADSSQPCVGPSNTWSCVRSVSPEELAKRDSAQYGFSAEEAEDIPYAAGTTEDRKHDYQIPQIPNATSYDVGYLKMKMTDKLKEIVFPWYNKWKGTDRVKKHLPIPGSFTNDHKVSMGRLDLDHYPKVHEAVIQEMKEILQWWSKQRLKHSVTFGLRIYTRGSMLINHLDRKDSHIVSAVLQIAQTVDEDGGWPLEVNHPHHHDNKEIYLQSGEMVLYEGARIFHGRPMRFRGDEFANIFSHFAPMDYRGARSDYTNPHYRGTEL